jgi:hypothetical protein
MHLYLVPGLLAAIVRDILKYKGKINYEYKESNQKRIVREGD